MVREEFPDCFARVLAVSGFADDAALKDFICSRNSCARRQYRKLTVAQKKPRSKSDERGFSYSCAMVKRLDA
jgi:hypothetical protein